MDEPTTTEMLKAALIHIVVPVCGIIFYLYLLFKAKPIKDDNSLALSLLAVFFNYSGLVIIILTSLFWYWSGLASLGLLYSVTIGPLLMIGIAIGLYRKRNTTKYHKIIFNLSALYVPIVGISYWLITML